MFSIIIDAVNTVKQNVFENYQFVIKYLPILSYNVRIDKSI